MEYFLELTTKISKVPKGEINEQWIKFEQQNKTNILSFIKILKKDEISHLKISEMKSQELTSITQGFIDFISKKQSYQSKLFLQALAALDCILSCSPSTFPKLNFNNAFCTNLRKFFCKLCDQYENVAQSQEEMTLKFQFYTVFYIIVILVYQCGKDINKQVKKMPLQIMNKTFILNLLQFQAPNNSKIKKLNSFLILYLVKKGNIKLWGKRLTTYILSNFDPIDNRKTIFNYIICLKQLNSFCFIQSKEIKKYDLVKKLKQVWLQYSNDPQSYYILEFVQQIFKIDSQFCQEFCDELIIDMLGVPQKLNSQPVFSSHSLQILETSSHYLQKDLFKKNLLKNIELWKQKLHSLKYVKIFFDVFTDKQIIQFLHSRYFQEIKMIIAHKDECFRLQGVEVIKKILQKLSTINVNVMNSVYSYFHQFLSWNQGIWQQHKKQMIDSLLFYYQRKHSDCSGFSLI